MPDKQLQKAGDNSQQLQAEVMIVNHGIDEKRVREICDEKFALARRDYSQEAFAIANARAKEFENSLVPKIAAIQEGLAAFADPSFQFLLMKAQKAAASTERIADYDLLSELLVHRIQKGTTDRNIRTGINRAVEIVENISDEALLGLTVAHCVHQFIPNSGDIHKGLDVLNNLYGKVCYGKLPTDKDWLDHLDILDAIRISVLGNFKKIKEFYPLKLDGYVAVGIKKDSENYNNAIKMLQDVGLDYSTVLVDHALNHDYVRIPSVSKSKIEQCLPQQFIINEGNLIPIPILNEQKKAIMSVYELYYDDKVIKDQNVQAFMAEWDNRQNLKELREWWEGLSPSFPSVGKVLAHANAQRCEKTLPSLN